MTGPISYDFQNLTTMGEDLRSRVRALTETHDELKGYVSGLAQQWGSTDENGAKNNYDAVQQQWDMAHEDLIHVLQTITKVVEDGVIDMQAKEAKNAAAWL